MLIESNFGVVDYRIQVSRIIDYDTNTSQLIMDSRIIDYEYRIMDHGIMDYRMMDYRNMDYRIIEDDPRIIGLLGSRIIRFQM